MQMTVAEDPNDFGNGEGGFESDPRPPLGSRGHVHGSFGKLALILNNWY